MTPEERARILEASYLFKGLDFQLLTRIVVKSSLQTYTKNDTLFHAGEEPNGMFIIVSGVMRVWVGSDVGAERTLRYLEANDVVGEIGLLDGLPRTANISAMEDSVALYIPRRLVIGLIEQEPQLALHFIELLCERIRYCIDDIGDFAFLNLRQRLARKLNELAFGHARIIGNSAKFGRRFSQVELSHMVGATREAVNKQLANMARDGVISISEGVIEIHDMTRLNRI